MKKYRGALVFLPANESHSSLKKAAENCRGCDLYKTATQTVFGEGHKSASLFFIGEQPGQSEDIQGRPFIGRAGQIFDEALAAAGIIRDELYVTNAVKHFKWVRRGKLRLHKRPSAGELKACSPWLEAEIRWKRPLIIVCLGATAAHSVFKRLVKIREARSHFQKTDLCENTFVTFHPSFVLRAQDSSQRTQLMKSFVADLILVKKKLNELSRR
jgi:uracil-DNA glycosylase family protein